MPTRSEIWKEKDWLTRCCLIALFHKEKARGTRRPRKWTISKTADELEYSSGYISEAIALSEHFDEVEKCKNRQEALLLMKTITEK